MGIKISYSQDLMTQIFKELTHYKTEMQPLFQTIKEN